MRTLFTLSLSCLILLAIALPASFAFEDFSIPEVKKAAEAGDPASQTQLGVLYARGIGVPRDKAEAVKWYRKAADQGYANAQWNLAFMYVRGDGVEQDYAQAIAWFRKAADQGDKDAQYDLGMMYLQGYGAPASSKIATEWFRKSAAAGNKDAAKALKELGEDVPAGETTKATPLTGGK